MRNFLLAASIGLAIGVFSSPAQAVTQCQVKMLRVWADTNGTVWLDFDNNTGVGISAGTPGRDQMMALGVAALTTGRSVIVRYAADNVTCSANRNDFLGLYLI